MDAQFKQLCKDIIAFSDEGVGHAPTLNSRLDIFMTQLKNEDKLENAPSILDDLVEVYFYCLTSVKVSKHIAKVLSNVAVSQQAIVECYMTPRVQKTVFETVSDPQCLGRVSCLIEQSSLGRHLLRPHLPVLYGSLRAVLHTSNTASLPISTKHAAILLSAVKVSLQLVQFYREDMKEAILTQPDESRSAWNDGLVQLIQSMITLLCKHSLESDIYLFGGTFLAMLLNLVPSTQDALKSFRKILEIFQNGSGLADIGGLSINIQMEEQKGNTISELTFIRAIIVCGKEDLLTTSASTSNKGENSETHFLFSLFPIVMKHCELNQNQYHAFQVLSLWYKCFCKLQTSLQPKKTNFSSSSSIYLSQTLKQTYLNWDSPIDGVTDYIGEIFQCLLIIWSREKSNGQTDNPNLAESLLQQFIDMTWNVKGKYKLISILLSHVNVCELLFRSRLKYQLLQCMTSNNLAPIASDVYKTCLINMQQLSGEVRLNKWRDILLQPILDGLLGSDQLLYKKLSEYWVPLTLKLLPEATAFLPCHLCDVIEQTECRTRRHKLLFVWLLVTRIIRSIKTMDPQDVNLSLLRECLYSDNEDMRGEVIAFLCGSMKKSELLSELECELLKSCLPLCLKVDSAPFRQQLIASMKKLMVRLRDGSLGEIKKKNPSTRLDTSLEFLDWLHRTLVDSLFPGASYQRLKTSLEILGVLYGTLVHVPANSMQRGQAHERCVAIFDYAKTRGLCDLFSGHTVIAVLSCIMDGADEVQELSSQLAHDFFPWSSLPFSYETSEMACHLLNVALQLCSSPKPYESRGGALLCNIIYAKYACAEGAVFERQTDSSELVCRMTGECRGHQFIQLLHEQIQLSVAQAERDSVTASKHSALHGLVQAVTLCLRNQSVSCDFSLLMNLVKVIMKVIQIMMTVMAGGKNIENCPSFAEMGAALESMVADSEEDSLTLTPAFQILLSWCWVNIKESCTCLGELTAAIVKHSTSVDTCLTEIADVGQIFIQVLKNCRVRGAIEGCRNGLLKYCTVLLGSEITALSDIPANILTEIVKDLESNVISASVTRRSAGLPVIVQVMAQAENRLKQHKLLTSTVDKLLALASVPFNPETDQTQDVVQVHALNILKAVFGDASLAPFLMASYTTVILIVFDGFESPSWAIRNSATQLFGTIVSRMFGPRGKGGAGQNVLTLQELSAHYPGLADAMLDRLRSGAQNVQHLESLHPSLFLVFTILANLGPADSKNSLHRLDAELKEMILRCLSTPVYTLRELASQAYTAFVSPDIKEQEIMDILGNLPSFSSDVRNHNVLHGKLLCVEKLICNRDYHSELKSKILLSFLQKSWILTELNQCPLLGAKYVQILRHLIQGLEFDVDTFERINSLLTSFKTGKSQELRIGAGLVTGDLQATLTYIHHENPQALTQMMCAWLEASGDIALQCLERLADILHDGKTRTLNWEHIQIKLWQILHRSKDVRLLTKSMNLLCDIKLLSMPSVEGQLSFKDIQCITDKSDPGSSLHAASIPVAAILIEKQLRSAIDTDISRHICHWSQQLLEASHPSQIDICRSAAVKGLLVSGELVLKTLENKLLKQDSILTSIVESVLRLLDDSDVDIRKMAARFVSSLKWKQRQVQFEDLNSTTCQEVFYQYLTDNFSWSEALVQYLLEKLYIQGEVITLSQKKRIASRCELLFESEETSVLAERPLQLTNLHNTVQTMLKTNMTLSKCYVSRLAESVQKEMEVCVPLLTVGLQGSPIINMSCDGSLFSAVLGLIFITDVLLTAGVDAETIGQLKTGLVSLHQLQDLHPRLRVAVSGILNEHA